MPGNLQPAAPSGVLPKSLATAFTESWTYPMLANSYHDGTPERALIVDGINAPTPIRTWKLSRRLNASDLQTLRAFFEAQQGGSIPFYFYDPFDVAPGNAIGSNWDGFGLNSQGRHVTVFRGDWSQTVNLARTDAPLELAEVA